MCPAGWRERKRASGEDRWWSTVRSMHRRRVSPMRPTSRDALRAGSVVQQNADAKRPLAVAGRQFGDEVPERENASRTHSTKDMPVPEFRQDLRQPAIDPLGGAIMAHE